MHDSSTFHDLYTKSNDLITNFFWQIAPGSLPDRIPDPIGKTNSDTCSITLLHGKYK